MLRQQGTGLCLGCGWSVRLEKVGATSARVRSCNDRRGYGRWPTRRGWDLPSGEAIARKPIRFAGCLIFGVRDLPERSKALEELDRGLHGGGRDQVAGVRQHREFASR